MPISETGHFTQLIEDLRRAEEHCSAIGLMRGDTRWIRIATLVHTIGEQVRKQAAQSANQALTILGREFKA